MPTEENNVFFEMECEKQHFNSVAESICFAELFLEYTKLNFGRLYAGNFARFKLNEYFKPL